MQSSAAAYCLMTRRNHLSYVAFLEAMKEYLGLNPPTVMSDYEVALQGAVTHVFSGTTLIGCLFHYTQASAEITSLKE